MYYDIYSNNLAHLARCSAFYYGRAKRSDRVLGFIRSQQEQLEKIISLRRELGLPVEEYIPNRACLQVKYEKWARILKEYSDVSALVSKREANLRRLLQQEQVFTNRKITGMVHW